MRALEQRFESWERATTDGMPARADELEAAAEDPVALRRLAHRLRGVAGGVLGALAAKVEAAAEAGDLAAVRQHLPELIAAARDATPRTRTQTVPEDDQAPRTASDFTPRASPSRILVADDEPAIRRLLSLTLRRRGGHHVETCDDGEQALARLRAETFDLVLLDAMMPGRDGIQVARAGLCPAVVLSAAHPSELGVDPEEFRWWRKPIQVMDLLSRVDALLVELQQS